MYVWGVLSLSLCLAGTCAAISVNRLSNIYLPQSKDPNTFAYNSNSATCGSFDKNKDFYYVGGSNLIHVFDIADINKPQFLHTHNLISGTVGDIQVCGDFVAVAFDNTLSPDDGKVIVFRGYNRQIKSLIKVHEITVGTNPRDLDFTKNCRSLLVAVEGTLTNYNGVVFDPEGLVVTISWLSNDLSQPYDLRFTDFTSYNDRANELLEKGVRWVYRGEGAGITNTLSQDLEPESIALNADESKAYISLQENNAVAIMEMENGTITDIVALGTRDFSDRGLDPSDRDGGVRISPWPVLGMFLPGNLEYLNVGDSNYLVTVNEGSERSFNVPDYPFSWRESRTGQELISEGLLSGNASEIMREFLSNDADLGRTRISTLDGRDGAGVLTPHVYGARSYSFHRIENDSLSLEFESGESLEQAAATALPSVFNADPTQSSMTPVESADIMSTFTGPKPSAVASAVVNNEVFLFIGAGRPGHVMVYSVPIVGPIVPSLQTVIYEGGNAPAPWQELYQNQLTGNLGIAQLEVISSRNSPNGNTLLVVTGSISGNVAFYEVTNPASRMDMVKNFLANQVSGSKIVGRSPVAPTGGMDPLALAALCLASVAAVLALIGIVIKRRSAPESATTNAEKYPL